MSRPHSRRTRTGSGSAGLGRGRRVNTGGRRVGGSSQAGRSSFPMGSSGANRGGGSSGGGNAGCLLAFLAIFALLPKKARIALVAVLAVLLVVSYISGGLAPSVQSSPPVSDTAPSYGTLGQLPSLFDTDELLQQDDIYGAGAEYSGSIGSGGLLQDLPGANTQATAAPQISAQPDDSQSGSLIAQTRDKRIVPLGGGRDTVTIMVYMCGTDLESKYGMGTSDLTEMTKAQLSDKVNLIVETGGCKNWKNSVVSSSANQIYRVHSGGLERLEENFGKKDMTDPDNLRDFIRYCTDNYPANRNILIFWDHGGGSISGFGYDEKSGSSAAMSLGQIDKALSEAGCVFDWIGFDACLMATMETAQVCGDHADYLIASEEVEPGTGWYYTDWLTALSENTSVSTEELGRQIIDDYVRACRAKSYSAQVTLSMTDLAKFQSSVAPVFRAFASSTNQLIASDDFRQVSDARAGTRQFAQSSRINQVDLCDLALRIDTEQSRALAKAIQSCITYNGSTISRCYGMSIYFPYENLNSVSAAINTYEAIGMDSEYAKCIRSFASLGYGAQVSSSASQNAGSYGSYSSYEDLLESLMGSYSGSSSPLGSLTGAYGSQSAGYSLSAQDIAGLFSAFAGRSMPQGYEWVDTGFLAESAARAARNFIDPARIRVSYSGGRPVLSLSEEEWALIQSVELNLFADDGQGFIDLGLDNVFEMDGNELILEHDGTWLCVNGAPAAYYMVSDTQNPNGSWTTIGRIPALLNGEFVNLQVIFDDDNPYGGITGAYPLYEDGQTQTQAKGLIPLMPGDRIEFLCDYYGYDGSYGSSWTLGSSITVDKGGFYLENLSLDGVALAASYRLTDIYGNHYWLSF